ncbi:YciI family protein [Altererythrobacter litoralis]|uniref:YciI family protein n=1 Tax=Altererythrobacter litoralis TaxID=3113904 RepID=A0ABU7GD26_9SPHN|nr:YciI family protein [Erythrobacteraceae bacterium 1XM1-14]
MFILSLSYVAPLEEVDALLEAHIAWLKQNHAEGRFQAWGRKIPRTGGMIFATVGGREEAEALAASDPFIIGGVATVEVTEFRATFAGAGLEALGQ